MARLDAYEYENEMSINPKLICPICLQPLHRPRITACDHVFCYSCLDVWHRKSATCPLCREPSKTKYTKSVRNPALLSQLNQLPVKCLLCEQTGIQRRDLKAHRDLECVRSGDAKSDVHSKCSRRVERDNSPLFHFSRFSFKFTRSRQRRITDLINQAAPYSRITLRSQQLTDADMSFVIQSAIEKKRCKILDLGSNRIGTYGVVHLADTLDKNSTLKILSLHRNPLSEKSVRYLANKLAKNNTELKWLDLEATHLTDSSAEHLANMLDANRSLTGLWLSSNEIGSRGVAKIAAALTRPNATLKYLDFENNQSIDDACLNSLVKMLQENHSLKTVYLNRCRLSAASKRKLREVAAAKPNFHLVL